MECAHDVDALGEGGEGAALKVVDADDLTLKT